MTDINEFLRDTNDHLNDPLFDEVSRISTLNLMRWLFKINLEPSIMERFEFLEQNSGMFKSRLLDCEYLIETENIHSYEEYIAYSSDKAEKFVQHFQNKRNTSVSDVSSDSHHQNEKPQTKNNQIHDLRAIHEKASELQFNIANAYSNSDNDEDLKAATEIIELLDKISKGNNLNEVKLLWALVTFRYMSLTKGSGILKK